MTIWHAVLWGGLSSAALFLGQAIAGPLTGRTKATGLLMGFGAGTLLSAVAYELVPQTSFGSGTGLVVWFLLGAVVYYIGDRIVDRSGGDDRTDIDGAAPDSSGTAMFLGALLDGLPEAFILGIGIAAGNGVSVAFVAAVFVSNIPQGAAGTISMLQAGMSQRTITWMWGALTAASALVAAAGFALADNVPNEGLYAQGFAGGALLGYLTAAALTAVG